MFALNHLVLLTCPIWLHKIGVEGCWISTEAKT